VELVVVLVVVVVVVVVLVVAVAAVLVAVVVAAVQEVAHLVQTRLSWVLILVSIGGSAEIRPECHAADW
jgi:Kef-type K+ transport system membrane component KefB